jgi:Eukaryotic aspartyl protease
VLTFLRSIGPVDLTSTTLSTGQQVPTVTDNLAKAGTIPANSIGIFYTTQTSSGELTFGGSDSSKISGSVNFVPITSTSPASEFWGIDQTVTYGSSGQSILATTAGMIDTGTEMCLRASFHRC